MQIELTDHIKKPPETVFAFFTDPASGPKISKDIRAVTLLSDRPMGVGSQFHEEIKEGRKYTTYLGTVLEYSPPRRYAFKLESWGCAKKPVPGTPSKHTINVAYTLSPDGAGTKCTTIVGCDLSKAGFFMRLFGSTIGKLMGGMMRKMMRQQMDAAKAAIEAQ